MVEQDKFVLIKKIITAKYQELKMHAPNSINYCVYMHKNRNKYIKILIAIISEGLEFGYYIIFF